MVRVDLQVKEDLIEYIFMKRKARGWTKAELAKRVGVEGATITRWTSTSYPDFPSVENLRKLGEAFGEPPDTFARKWIRRQKAARLQSRLQDATGDGANDVRESYAIGRHIVEHLQDGSLRVNGITIPEPRGGEE